ncbi:MAG: hypothetical protein WB586_01545 [Chthoniobacterales bacterium]
MNSSRLFHLHATPVNIDGWKAVDIPSIENVLLLFTALPLILLSLFGCASIGSTYEGGRNNILNDDRQYKLAAIEFGELGSYADAYKGELNNTIQLLKNTERPLLVVYIHGWLNNATSGEN